MIINKGTLLSTYSHKPIEINLSIPIIIKLTKYCSGFFFQENEIAAAEDNLRIWTEKYEMEVRREAVTAQVDAKMALDAAKIRLEQLTAQYKPEHLTRFETLPVPPKFVPPLPIITEEIKKEIQPKVTRSKKKKKKK